MTNEQYLKIENNFLNDLKKVFKEHSIALQEVDDYNGIDEFIGTSFYFVIGKQERKVKMTDTFDEVIKNITPVIPYYESI